MSRNFSCPSRWTVVSLLLVLLPTLVAAGQLQLSWTFNRAYTPAPDAFLITIESQSSARHFTVRPSAKGVCGRNPGMTEDTFCARVPCPEAGVYELRVQAVFQGAQSAPATVGCVFAAQFPCQCLAVATRPTTAPGSPSPDVPTGQPTTLGRETPPPTEPSPTASPDTEQGLLEEFDAIDAAYRKALQDLSTKYFEDLLKADSGQVDRLTLAYQEAQRQAAQTYQDALQRWQEQMQAFERARQAQR